MIIYNVTANVEENIAEEWLMWMKETHIPNVMNTGCFKEFKILKLLNEQPDASGITYAVQYFVQDMKTMHEYTSKYATGLQMEVLEKYGQRVVAFRTLLEEV
ncbi:MAG: DUF4286 family protein [Cyclobacteriaceae bacterium]